MANFYRRRDKWNAVVSRLNVVARDFDGLGYEEKVYFGLYDAYRKLSDDAKKRIEIGRAELAAAQAEKEKTGDSEAVQVKLRDAEQHIKDAEAALKDAEGKPEQALQTLVAKYPDTDAAKRARRVLEK